MVYYDQNDWNDFHTMNYGMIALSFNYQYVEDLDFWNQELF